MIKLTETLSWDDSVNYEDQSNEVKNFVQNVISSYDKATDKEAIPNSPFFRVLKAMYNGVGFQIVEIFEYQETANASGWAAVKNYKIDCYVK